MTKSYVFGKALMRLGGTNAGSGGMFNFTTDTFTVLLVQSDYALSEFIIDNQEFISEGTSTDVQSHEVSSGLGYVRQDLVFPVWDFVDGSEIDPSNSARLSDSAGAPTTFTEFTGTFQYAVLAKNTGVDATSPLLMIVDFEQEIPVSDANFVISWKPEGILRFKAIQEGALPESAVLGAAFPITFPLTIAS